MERLRNNEIVGGLRVQVMNACWECMYMVNGTSEDLDRYQREIAWDIGCTRMYGYDA